MNLKPTLVILGASFVLALIIFCIIIGISSFFGNYNNNPQTYSAHTITVIDKYDYNFIIVANVDNITQLYQATTLTDYLKFIRGNNYTIVISKPSFGYDGITNGTIRQILNSKDKTIIGNYTVIPQGNTT